MKTLDQIENEIAWAVSLVLEEAQMDKVHFSISLFDVPPDRFDNPETVTSIAGRPYYRKMPGWEDGLNRTTFYSADLLSDDEKDIIAAGCTPAMPEDEPF